MDADDNYYGNGLVALPKDEKERKLKLALIIMSCINKHGLERCACSNQDKHRKPTPMDDWRIRFPKRCECGAELDEN